ncbi:hypothetical protein PS005_24985, partial [Shigella sonnei]|nr:hypothetical protein [Shigella sonnei]
GKILKSPTYSDVDLSSFVEQAKASAKEDKSTSL